MLDAEDDKTSLETEKGCGSGKDVRPTGGLPSSSLGKLLGAGAPPKPLTLAKQPVPGRH